MKNIITIGDKQFYYTTFGTLAFGDPDTFVGRTIKDKDVQAFIPTVIAFVKRVQRVHSTFRAILRPAPPGVSFATRDLTPF